MTSLETLVALCVCSLGKLSRSCIFPTHADGEHSMASLPLNPIGSDVTVAPSQVQNPLKFS